MRSAARFIVLGMLLALGAALAPQRPAQAGAYAYSTTRRTFKVGILLLDSSGLENPDPYVFYIADTRADLKPQNWEFVNPLAPKTVTSEVSGRWRTRNNGTAPYQLGQTVTKNMAPYWEVYLSKSSIEDLLQFDLLFITHHQTMSFTPADREKLRKLVDAGGIVWVEDCGSMRVNPNGPFFLEDLQFGGTFGTGGGGPVVNAPNHPLLNTPYKLTYEEVANLGDKNFGSYFLRSITDATKPPNPDILINIVGNAAGNGLPYIAAGNYGSGAVIATAGDSGCDINDYAGGTDPIGSGGNSGPFCGPNLQTAHAEDLKFVYNMVAWGGANNSERRNARRQGASFDAVGAPLVTRFDFTTAGTPAGSVVGTKTTPLIVKEVAFVTGVVGGKSVLRAYDLQPSRDMDGDGNPDDGVPDFNYGAPYDEIWRADLGNAGDPPPSAPTFATIYNRNNGQVYEAVFVTLGKGELAAFRAFPAGGDGRLQPTNAPVYTNANVPGGSVSAFSDAYPAPSPLFYEGKMFVVEPDGLIRCVDAATGTTLYQTFNRASVSTSFQPVGPPTIGMVRLRAAETGRATGIAENSQGNTLDLMLYLPVRETSGSGTGRILAYFLGARNEVPRTNPGTPGQFTTRAKQNDRYFVARGGGTAGEEAFVQPTVRVFANNYPNPDTTSRENYERGLDAGAAGFAGTVARDGTIVVTKGAAAPLPSDGVLVSVSYDVVYVTPSGAPGGLTGDASREASGRLLRTSGAGMLEGLRTVALSPDDLLLYAALEQGVSSTGTAAKNLTSVYATNEQSEAGTKIRWRFTAHEGYGSSLGTPVTVNGQDVNDPAPLTNTLAFSNAWPSTDQAITAPREALRNIVPVGAPIVTNDGLTYVLANAVSGYNGNVAVLMAFRTNREIVLTVGPMDPARPPQVAQADTLNPGGTVPLQANQLSVDYGRGKITIANFLPPAGGGAAASASQSFVVTATPVGGTPATYIYKPNVGGTPVAGDRTYSTPLEWYYVLPGGAAPGTSPTLIGDYIYYVGAGGATTRVIAVDADPGASDPQVKTGQQVPTVVATLNGTAQELSHIRWVKDLAGRNGAPAVGAKLTGAQGALVVGTENLGPFVFEDSVTLIADGKRVLEARGDGSAVWALDATVDLATAGGELPIYTGIPANPIANPPASGRRVRTTRPITRPSTVRRLSASDLLIADTGNDRVVRVDRGGQVLWELDKLSDPYGILASGDPVTLSGPTDVQFWVIYSYTNGVVTGYETHYLIADAGNFRIIEVADYFDARGNVRNAPDTNEPGQRVLIWTTRTASREGRRLRYQSIERFISDNGTPVIVAVVGNLRASGGGATATSDFTGGALVQVNYNPYKSLFNPIGGTPFRPWPDGNPATSTEPGTNGVIGRAVDDLIIPAALSPTGQEFVKRINRPLYFQQITKPDPATGGQKPVYLLCDADGVFEIEPRTVGGRTQRVVTWMFTQNDYNRMNGVDGAGNVRMVSGNQDPTNRFLFPTTSVNPNALPRFLPASVRLLGSGDFLITNSFTGSSTLFDSPLPAGQAPAGRGQFLGEVFQVRPTRDASTGLGLGGTFADFSVPKIIRELIRDTNGNVVGVKNRQQMGDGSNTSVLEQPLFADRLL